MSLSQKEDHTGHKQQGRQPQGRLMLSTKIGVSFAALSNCTFIFYTMTRIYNYVHSNVILVIFKTSTGHIFAKGTTRNPRHPPYGRHTYPRRAPLRGNDTSTTTTTKSITATVHSLTFSCRCVSLRVSWSLVSLISWLSVLSIPIRVSLSLSLCVFDTFYYS